MIFQSKQTVNGSPLWAVDTDTQTVTHINPRSGETEHYVFHTNQIRYHLHHVEELFPERLQKLVDEGKIYKYLDELDIKVTDAVNRQTELLMQSSREYQIANEIGDLYKVGSIGNMLQMQARDSVFKAMVYV